MTRRAAVWIVLALLGIAATAAVAWFASQLAGQRIGLSSEPLSVAAGLAPVPARAAAPPSRPRRPGHTRTAASAPAAAPAPAPAPATLPFGSAPSQPPVTPAPSTTSPPPPASSGHDSSTGGGQSNDPGSGPDD